MLEASRFELWKDLGSLFRASQLSGFGLRPRALDFLSHRGLNIVMVRYIFPNSGGSFEVKTPQKKFSDASRRPEALGLGRGWMVPFLAVFNGADRGFDRRLLDLGALGFVCLGLCFCICSLEVSDEGFLEALFLEPLGLSRPAGGPMHVGEVSDLKAPSSCDMPKKKTLPEGLRGFRPRGAFWTSELEELRGRPEALSSKGPESPREPNDPLN